MSRMTQILTAAGAALIALAVLGLDVAAAQQIRTPRAPGTPGVGGGGDAPLTPQATSFEPEKVRTLMLSIHGYTRAQLEAASTDVDQVLMVLADDPDELMLVRRQAVKGLRLYPTEEVLNFIEGRVDQAPLGLKRLYLSSLSGFVNSHPGRVTAIMEDALNDSEITIRYAGLNLARKLEGDGQVNSILQQRLDTEPDPTLRNRISSVLSGS